MKAGKSVIFSVVLMLVFSLALSIKGIYAGDTDELCLKAKETLNEYMKTVTVDAVDDLKTSGEWVLIKYRAKSKEGDTWSNSALLKKNTDRYEFVSFSNFNPTTDFLKKCKVPDTEWENLLGKDIVSRDRDLLDFLHKTKPGYYVEEIRHSGNWVMISWTLPEQGWEGQGILKGNFGKWKIVNMGGGALDKSSLQHFGVPPGNAEELISSGKTP